MAAELFTGTSTASSSASCVYGNPRPGAFAKNFARTVQITFNSKVDLVSLLIAGKTVFQGTKADMAALCRALEETCPDATSSV
jgi:hypothetical protein